MCKLYRLLINFLVFSISKQVFFYFFYRFQIVIADKAGLFLEDIISPLFSRSKLILWTIIDKLC